MKIYKVNSEGEIFIVIAESSKEAKQILIDEYFDGEKTKLEVENEKELKKGIVVNYDYEDFYWNE